MTRLGRVADARASRWRLPRRAHAVGYEPDGRGLLTIDDCGHTHATLDRLDRRDLRDLAALVAESVRAAADPDREFERRDPDEIRDGLDDGSVRELRAGGRRHFDA